MNADDAIDFVFEKHLGFSIICVAVIAASALVGSVLASVHDQHQAYSVYCRETGRTNLTYGEFVVMKDQHLLQPLNHQ